MLHVNVARYHTTNRTASSNSLFSLACMAGLEKYAYGDGNGNGTYIGNFHGPKIDLYNPTVFSIAI